MEIIKLNINDINEMYELFNEYVTEGKHLKYLSFEDYKDKLLSNPDFDFNFVYGIKENG